MMEDDDDELISSEQAFKENALAFIKEQQEEGFLGMPEIAQIFTELIAQEHKKGNDEWKADCVEALQKVAFEESSEYEKAKKDFEEKFDRLLGDAMTDAKLSRLDILLVIIECLNDEGFEIDCL
jgi:hypothetical protein